MWMIRNLRRGALVVLAGAIVLYAICGIAAREHAVRQATKARSLLIDLRQLSADHPTSEDLLRLAKQYGGKIQSPGCTPDLCEVRFELTNRWLHRLSLSPFTGLQAGVMVQRGQLTSLWLGMGIQPPGSITMLSAGTEIFLTDIIHPPFQISFSGATLQVHAVAKLAPRASSAERAVAFDYNVSCLYRLGGCRDAAELVPTWWEIEKRKPPLGSPE